MKKNVFIILVLFSNIDLLFAQFYNNDVKRRVDITFFYNKIESAANSSIFNIVSIKNNRASLFKGKLVFTQPADWKIIGKSEIDVEIPANDSISLPIRAIVSKNVVGEVGYAIIANLYDENKKPLISEYCFITIPRVSKLKIVAPRRIVYFDNKTETAQFQYFISNRGNTDENVQLTIKSDENLSVEQQRLSKIYAYEYNIPAHKDTTIDVKIKLEEKIEGKDSYKTDVTVFTQDSLYKNNLWLFKVEDIYNHKIPENNKCAIIELTASDVLSEYEPRYSLMAKGRVLFKKNLDFYYYLHKNDITNSWEDYYDSRFYVGIKNDYFDIRVGTIESIFNEYIYGLGGKAEFYYPNKRLTIGGFYSQNNQSSQIAYGGQASYRLSKHVGILLGYAQNNFDEYKNYSKILLSGINFSFLKNNSLSIISYLNQTRHAQNIPFNKEGIGLISTYSGNFKKLHASARLEYGSPDYSGISQGKLISNANINYQLNNKDFLNLSYLKNDLISTNYIYDIPLAQTKSTYDALEFNYSHLLTKHLSVQAGPLVRFEKFNIPYIDTIDNFYFKTYSSRLSLALKYSKHSSKLYIRPSIDIGNIVVSNALGIENAEDTEYLTYNINLNAFYKATSLYLTYRNGPHGIYNQYYYYSADYFSKWLFLMPAYSKFFFNNKLNLDIRATYRLDVSSKNSSINLTTQLIMWLAKTWNLRILNSMSSSTRRDAINSTTLRYNSTYFEVALRKEFNCNQARFQYHNLKIVFFKDLNGNRVKEPNEPGLRNVLAAIEPDYEIENDKTHKDFAATKLLTAPEGTIAYNNIVNGNYKLKYTLIGDMVGNFNREEQIYSFNINDDKTIYIPYLENNRIVGKIILNRDPLSSLGNIDISNIRIIAEDTKGHTYSALTDKQGNFIIYAPVTDHYVVRINNIFYESFDLQQNEFIVKFNGYKQFEIAFVFNEKKRKINFDTQDESTTNPDEEEFNVDELKAIRKTTLSGKIRDVISLEPVGATINIINNTTNKVISSTISNKITGNYNISYVADENYRIEIKADGYENYLENLYIEQVISIQNIAKDIMLIKKK